MAGVPVERTPDATLSFLRQGYDFLPRRFRRFGADTFRTRLMFRGVLCVQGEDAARMFYAPDRFTRRGALPPTALLSLQDAGSVQTLDGAAHRRRKAMFLSLMSRPSVTRLGETFEREWRARLTDWSDREQVVLFPEVRSIICRAVCAWGGSPVSGHEADARAEEFGAMIDGAGAIGPRNWRGLALRARTERWARDLIVRTRSGVLRPPDSSPLAVIAGHRDEAGALMGVKVAAVEYLNVLRPTVAVDRFIVFAALALHDHPAWRDRVRSGDQAVLTAFAQEVRRFYPFFPAVGGRALVPFEWRGLQVRKGAWVLLDIFGGDHDPRSWREPERFDPDRFLRGEANAYNFIPQGGGAAETGHRCPGEPITLELMVRAVRLLAGAMDYQIPPQDLGVDLSRMPAIPKSRFVISGVRPADA